MVDYETRKVLERTATVFLPLGFLCAAFLAPGDEQDTPQHTSMAADVNVEACVEAADPAPEL